MRDEKKRSELIQITYQTLKLNAEITQYIINRFDEMQEKIDLIYEDIKSTKNDKLIHEDGEKNTGKIEFWDINERMENFKKRLMNNG